MWWLVVLAAIGGIIATLSRNGFTIPAIMILLPILYTLFNTVYSNFRGIRIFFRKSLNWLNISTFDIEFQSTFKLTPDSKIKNINKDYSIIEDLIYSLLKLDGYNESPNKLVDVSLDRVSGVRFFIRPHKIYFSIDQSDDGGITTLNIKAEARLKFKNGEKLLNDFLLGIYEKIEDLGLSKDKYIVKMSKNTKNKNFMKLHFIKELTSNEINSFSIHAKPKNLNIVITQEKIKVTATQKHDLIQGIRYSIELIN